MSDNFLDKFAITGLATLAGFHQFATEAKAVGAIRNKLGVKPPSTDGPPEFLRTFRAQQNSVEFLPVSLAGLWVASGFFHPVPASVAYFGYVYGRQKYFAGYVEDAEIRTPGFYLSMKFLRAILLMCFIGIGHKAVRHYGNVDLLELFVRNCPLFSN